MDFFLDFFNNPIFDLIPPNIWIGLLKPVRLPAHKYARTPLHLNDRFFQGNLPFKIGSDLPVADWPN